MTRGEKAPTGGGRLPIRVVLTGAESTGKTTLAATLARRFSVPWSGEHARAYVAALDRPLALSDVTAIGAGQRAGEDQATAAAPVLVLHDTDLLSTILYSRHYFGSSPPAVDAMFRGRTADAYLLLHPDVPHVADGAQRGSHRDREVLHQKFREALTDLVARVVDVRGSFVAREREAVEAIEKLLQERALA